MGSNSEVGHTKNIANAKKLNDQIAGLGTYSPTNPLLASATMVTQQGAADVLQQAVNAQFGIYQTFQNARVIVFGPLKKLARRVRSAAKACGASAQWFKDVNAVVRKILGERASKATPTPEDSAGTSASQQSFDQQIDHLDKLIGLLSNEPLYVPNEADLMVTALTTLKGAMVTANDNAKTGIVPLQNAIIDRNKALYTKDIGLVDVFQLSKSYFKSAYGSSSPEYKNAAKCKFKKVVKI